MHDDGGAAPLIHVPCGEPVQTRGWALRVAALISRSDQNQPFRSDRRSLSARGTPGIGARPLRSEADAGGVSRLAARELALLTKVHVQE